MTEFFGDISRRGCALRAVLSLALVTGCAPGVHAQSEDASSLQPEATTPPYTLFNYSTITSSGNTIMASRVPVVLAGKTIYQDVTLAFDVSATGVLTLAPGYPKFIASPNLITANFKAGKYVGPTTVLNDQAIVNITGPGISSGGATQWSLTAAAGANGYTYPCSATWYVGPITSNPLYQRLLAAKIPAQTLAAYSFGVIGSSACPVYSYDWYHDGLIGVIQTGNTLTMVSFTYGTADEAKALDQITYTLQ